VHEIPKELITQIEQLDQTEREKIEHALQVHFGKPMSLSQNGLRFMNAEELETIRGTVSGWILTRENVPDIISAYKTFKGF